MVCGPQTNAPEADPDQRRRVDSSAVMLRAVGAIQKLHDGADLAAQETARGDVCEERDDIEEPWCGVDGLSPLLHEATR